MTWFCPSCFAELPGQAQWCSRCGAVASADRGFEAALIGALRHPLHDRRLLAARILGARRVAAAVPALITAVEDGDDPYLAAEAARALVAIGAPEGIAVARRLATDGPVVAAAQEALGGSARRDDPHVPSAGRHPEAEQRDRRQDRDAAAEAVQQEGGLRERGRRADRRSATSGSSAAGSLSP
jgi:HEAT repeats